MALFRGGFVIWVIVGWLLASGSCDDDEFHRAFPIVEPDSAHTKLRLAREGLEAIQRITNPIAVVGVIGPYRSGKSFLLNQLLSLPCDKGFGVGHMRDTKTKGIWAWGIPVEMTIDGLKVSVLYIDTEGFESVGKSNVYDDRIFALATIMSSVLIYNLPETIREADISRLSFAVEIAEEFYSRVKGQDVAFQPAKLLWLIQRDFLRSSHVDGINSAPNYVKQIINMGPHILNFQRAGLFCAVEFCGPHSEKEKKRKNKRSWSHGHLQTKSGYICRQVPNNCNLSF